MDVDADHGAAGGHRRGQRPRLLTHLAADLQHAVARPHPFGHRPFVVPGPLARHQRRRGLLPAVFVAHRPPRHAGGLRRLRHGCLLPRRRRGSRQRRCPMLRCRLQLLYRPLLQAPVSAASV